QVWMPGSYDPETHLYIIGTGNPTPAYTALLRGPRDVHTNLYTCSVVAVNVETGKMAWYFQTSPNDTHDWDSTQPSVLVDGMFGGKPRKMAMQTSRNGYFYVLDRTSGEHLLTMKYSDAANWAQGINAKGQLVRNPEKDNTVAGSLGSPDNGGGRSAVRQRRVWGFRRLWPAGNAAPGASLARPYRLDRERRGDLHSGRPPICARDR